MTATANKIYVVPSKSIARRLSIQLGREVKVGGVLDAELKPCPFCGGAAVSEDHGDNGWFCGCTNDKCEIRPSGWWDSESEARRYWNKRG